MNQQIKKIEEQEEVMQVLDKNLIISASAGSGKTTLMIRKILQYIIEKKIPLKQILVLTYTDSASGEMKKKLIEKLKDNLQEYEFLQNELEDSENADICTFDSFCQKLVKKYFYILNIDPSFNILQGGDEKNLKQECILQALKKLRQTDSVCYENLINNLSKNRNEENIKNIIFEIYNFLISILDQEKFLNQTLMLYDNKNTQAIDFLNQYFNEQMSQLTKQLTLLHKKCVDFEISNYVPVLSENIATCEQFLREPNFLKKVDFCKDVKILDLKKDEKGENLRQEFLKIKKEIKSIFDYISKNYQSSEEINQSFVFSQKIIANLITLLKSFQEEYSLAKTKNNCYDFNDIERLTIKLLQNPDIAKEVKNNYQKVFIDEFQDANSVQEQIINLIKKENNLFFVGDTKQSIYAFRQSDPEIFLKLERLFQEEDNSCAKRLNCNFRTNKNILNFVNKIFSVIMTNESADLDYLNCAQFNPQANYEDLQDEVCVEIDLIKDQQEKQKQKPIKVYSVKENKNQQQDNLDNQCVFVANKIIELCGQKIYDKDSQNTKEIQFSDITILLRKRGVFLKNLIKTFTKIGIPFIVNVNDDLEDCYDNKVLYNIIKLSQNYKDDYAMYFVLSSDLFNFSDSELALIKDTFKEEEYFYNCIINYSKQTDQIALKINNFFEVLNNFAFDIKYKGIYFALNQLLIKTNYLINISDQEDFIERKLNIEEYINYFNGSKYDANVEQYILYREISNQDCKKQTDKSFISAVEITTMHSSKGLEYPVVILPNLEQDIIKEPENLDIKINKNLGIGIKNFNEEEREVSLGVFYDACRFANKKQSLGENIRLLYVAMTRAKNKLILTGLFSEEFTQIKSLRDISNCKTYLSMIIGALDKDLIQKINKFDEFESNVYDNSKLRLGVYDVNVQDSYDQKQNQNFMQNSDNVEILSDFLNKQINQNKKQIALKNSVSMLAFDENSCNTESPYDFLVKEHTPVAKNEIGTLYHDLLQKIDFFEINNIDDLSCFIESNFSQDQINIFKNLNYQNIFNNINCLKGFAQKSDIVLKEQKFVMRVNHDSVSKSGISDKILIQGIIDLIIIKPDKILLIDYKLTRKSDTEIINIYSKQISLYKMALSKQYKNIPIICYFFNLTTSKIIEIKE